MRGNALALSVAIVIGVAGAASGQNYCGKSSQSAIELMGAELFGDWSMLPLGGYFVEAGEVLPFPPMDPMIWSIIHADGGRALIVSPEFSDSVELSPDYSEEQRLLPADFPDQVDRPLTEEDIGIAAGCQTSELPRLIAKSQFKTDDSQIDSIVRLIVIGPGIMYGAIEANGTVVGDTIYAYRAISLTR